MLRPMYWFILVSGDAFMCLLQYTFDTQVVFGDKNANTTDVLYIKSSFNKGFLVLFLSSLERNTSYRLALQYELCLNKGKKRGPEVRKNAGGQDHKLFISFSSMIKKRCFKASAGAGNLHCDKRWCIWV